MATLSYVINALSRSS